MYAVLAQMEAKIKAAKKNIRGLLNAPNIFPYYCVCERGADGGLFSGRSYQHY